MIRSAQNDESIGGGDPIMPPIRLALAGRSADFRRCYETGLASDRTLHGWLIVTAALEQNGHVLRVTSSGIDPRETWVLMVDLVFGVRPATRVCSVL